MQTELKTIKDHTYPQALLDDALHALKDSQDPMPILQSYTTRLHKGHMLIGRELFLPKDETMHTEDSMFHGPAKVLYLSVANQLHQPLFTRCIAIPVK